jgi:hypothetical protein
MEESVRLHAPAVLPPGKKPRYPLDRRLGGPQSRSGRGAGQKNSQPLPGLEPPIIQPVAQRYTDWAIPRLLKGKVKNLKSSLCSMSWRHIGGMEV